MTLTLILSPERETWIEARATGLSPEEFALSVLDSAAAPRTGADVIAQWKPRERPNALAWFASLDITHVGVPGFVAMELHQNARSADGILRPLMLVWSSQAACGQALADFRRLHLSHGLGLADALIGTTARELGATLCTFNVKHCKPVPGLTTEQPYLR